MRAHTETGIAPGKTLPTRGIAPEASSSSPPCHVAAVGALGPLWDVALRPDTLGCFRGALYDLGCSRILEAMPADTSLCFHPRARPANVVSGFEDLTLWWLRHGVAARSRHEDGLSSDGCVPNTLGPILKTQVWSSAARAAVSRCGFCIVRTRRDRPLEGRREPAACVIGIRGLFQADTRAYPSHLPRLAAGWPGVPRGQRVPHGKTMQQRGKTCLVPHEDTLPCVTQIT